MGDSAVCLLVIQGLRPFCLEEHEFLKIWNGKRTDNLFVALTWTDHLSQGGAEEANSSVRRILGPVFTRPDKTFDEELYRRRVFFTALPLAARISGGTRSGVVPLKDALLWHLGARERAGQFLSRNFRLSGDDFSLLRDLLSHRPYSDIPARCGASGEEMTVAFCGGVNAGKSTLINRLLGAEILPTKFTTSTAAITRIEYGSAFEAFVERCGVQNAVSLEEAHRAILYADGQDFNLSVATTVRFRLPCPLLKSGVVLVDTPGIGDYEELTEISLRQLEQSDLCVMVFTAERFNKLSDRQLYERLNRTLGGNIVFAVNKCDLVFSPQEYSRLLEYESASLKGFGNRLAGYGTVFHTCCMEESEIDLDGLDQWICATLPGLASRLKSTAREARLYRCVRELAQALEEEYDAVKRQEESERAAAEKAGGEKLSGVRQNISRLRDRLFAFETEQIGQLRKIHVYISETLAAYRTQFNQAMLQKRSLAVSDTFEWKKTMLLRAIFPAFFENVQDAFQKEFSGTRAFWGDLPGQLRFPALPDERQLVSPEELPKAHADTSAYGWLFGSVCYLVGSFDAVIDTVKNTLIPRSELLLRGMFEELETQVKTMEKAAEDHYAAAVSLAGAAAQSHRLFQLQKARRIVLGWSVRFR